MATMTIAELTAQAETHPRRGRARRRRQARRPRARPARDPRRRPRPDRGLPGPGQDADRPLVRAGDRDVVLADPVHARPDAGGRDRLVDLQPAARRLRVPPGPDLREPPPRRRDQPRAAEDAGRAARGDAGAAGHDRGRDPTAGPAVRRARDAEPDRVRGDVPASRGAARSLHAPHRSRVPGARARVGDARAADRARGGRGRALPGRQSGESSARCSMRSSRCTSRSRSATTSSISRWRPAARLACRSGRARAGRSLCSSSRGAGPRSPDATT